MKNKKFPAIVWMALYTILTFTPISMMLLGPKFSGRSPILDVSVGLGFTGLAIMALQFLSSARIKVINRPFGTDIIYDFHRQIGIASFLMVFAHPILLFILDQRYLRLLNIITAPWRARAGVTALLLLIGVVWAAEYRQKLKIPYQFWKFWHGIMATLMVALALVHIFLAGQYLDLPWKKGLWIGYSALFLGLLLYTRVLYPLRLMRRTYRIEEVKPERGDVWTLQLRPQGHPGFEFIPGQFVWLTAWKTPFSDTEHPFSIASSAQQKDHISLSIKNLGPFTATIQNLKPNDTVFIDGPYGIFSSDLYPNAERFVFIPGGIGVTPIMSMLRTMADRKDKRPILLFYCNREWESVTFGDEIKRLEKSLNLTTIYTIENPPKDWESESGFLNAKILKKYIPLEWVDDNTELFLCGPTPMMNAVEKELSKVYFPEHNIHSERYTFA